MEMHDGLTTAIAEEKRRKFGWNVITGAKRTPAIIFFLRQFKNSMVLILIGASIFAYFAGEGIDALIITGIVLLNAVIGFIQEYKAEKAIEALKKLLAPKVRVIRDGKEQILDAKELVPDDLVIINEGDKISADCILIENNDLQADESILTGESVPVTKDLKENSKLFMGTQITHGTGKALVVHTGMQTEFGKIATLTSETEKDVSPLQKEITHIGSFVGKITILIAGILILVGVFIQERELIDTLLFAVSVAVAAVPEGLPAIITIALALGVQRLAGKNAIIKQLSSVETLGSTTIICSDKTGTLTKNQMTVQDITVGGQLYEVSGVGYEPRGSFSPVLPQTKEIELAMRTAILCNNAKLVEDSGRWQILGDPTEGALLTLAAKSGFTADKIAKAYNKIAEVPFDSERKRMSIIAQDAKTKRLAAYIKGAPESILERCTHRMENGELLPMNDEDRKTILKKSDVMAQQALRTIGLAYKKDISQKPREKYNAEQIEEGLIYLGIVGMIDPPREEVKEAVRLTKEAGIRVFIITGDYGPTALAIAKKLGIAKEKTKVITGEELAKIDNEKLGILVKKTEEVIFARVKPSDKLRIVEALKTMGEVVAVTGDGVNDAPALKRADIGVAMGITGTDVSKEAANMVLTDDSFGSIVTAVIEGRTIYENMKKFIFYIFSSNIGELVAIFGAIIIGLHAPLTAVLLLIINTLTDVFPALALGVEPVEKAILEQPPRNPKARIMERKFIMRYAINGFWIGVITVSVFVWSLLQQGFEFGDNLSIDSEQYMKAVTMAFVVLTFFQMLQTFNARSATRSIFRMPFFNNMYLIAAVTLSTVATIIFVELPFFQEYLGTQSLNQNEWILVSLLPFTILFWEEVRKFIEPRLNGKSSR